MKTEEKTPEQVEIDSKVLDDLILDIKREIATRRNKISFETDQIHIFETQLQNIEMWRSWKKPKQN